MAETGSPDLRPNAQRFAGFADLYDQVRPHPPDALAEVLMTYCRRPSPAVADLGSGTGLSTRWAAGWAGSVIGVEPSSDMRARAAGQELPNVQFVSGYAHRTGLPDSSADVVLAVQSFHWMEPSSTLAEVARILRPGGVFAAIDCDWPPTIGFAELEQAWAACGQAVEVYDTRLARGLEGAALHAPIRSDDPVVRAYSSRDAHRDGVLASDVSSWSKDSHLDRMRDSARFAWCHELALHQIDHGDAERFMDLFRSQGGYQGLRRHGLADDVLGVPQLEQVARRLLGADRRPWWFTYRARVGILPP
jgi:SAM-dependent methyltransferase